MHKGDESMHQNIGTLSIVGYDFENPEHRKFKRELISDLAIYQYFKHTIEQNLEKSKRPQELKIETAYFISYLESLVGYIYLGSCDFNGTLSLDYAVHEDHRGNQYGLKILKEVRTYLLTNMPQVKNIDLSIQKDNRWSIETALNANFKFHRQIDDIKHYRYFI